MSPEAPLVRLSRAVTDRAARLTARPAVRAVLGVSLARKLVGANALVASAAAAVALGAFGAAGDAGVSSVRLLAWLLVPLAAALALSLGLVALALCPLHALEQTADEVWRGDLRARVPASPLADPAVARVGRAFNAMLDGLARDRTRMRELTAEVIRAGADERARIGRELQDSAAQTLAAALYQLSAARQALAATPDEPRPAAPSPSSSAVPAPVPVDSGVPAPPALAAADAALTLAHRLATDALDELRALARDIDPPGLAAAAVGRDAPVRRGTA